MTKATTKAQPALSQVTPEQLFRGAVVDADGREIPITEQMIREACNRLEGAASTFYPRPSRLLTAS